MTNKVAISPNKANAELCRRSFFYFFQTFWPVVEVDTLTANWHIKYICSQLEEAGRRVANRQASKGNIVINIPPGMTKSSLVSVMFPAWCWTIDPTIRFISSSYSAGLSLDLSQKSRDVIMSEKYINFFDIHLRDDVNTKSHFKNRAGGERNVTSTGGTITGKHAHIVLVDDPIKPDSAVSETKRKAANSHVEHTLPTRQIRDKSATTILVMQRLHVDDPAGRMAKEDSAIHICLPGRQSDDIMPKELVKNYDNGLLDVNRLDNDELLDLKNKLGSYGFAGQIQQRPSPEEGGIWQKWLKPITQVPGDLIDVGFDWDLAYTKKETNSASAFVKTGYKDGNVYILDVGYVFKEFPELIALMKSKQGIHYIEGKASGKSARQSLIREGINAVEVNVESDKVARARSVTPMAESGRVYALEHVIEQLYHDSQQGILQFPNGSHDDVADALAQALTRHNNKTGWSV